VYLCPKSDKDNSVPTSHFFQEGFAENVVDNTFFIPVPPSNLFGKCYNVKDRNGNPDGRVPTLANKFQVQPSAVESYNPLSPDVTNWYLDLVDQKGTSMTFQIKCKEDSGTKAYLSSIASKAASVGCPPVKMSWCSTNAWNNYYCKDFLVTGVYFVYKFDDMVLFGSNAFLNDPYLNNTCNLTDAIKGFAGGNAEDPSHGNTHFKVQLSRNEVVINPSLTTSIANFGRFNKAPLVIKIKNTTGFQLGDKIILNTTDPKTNKQLMGNFSCLRDKEGRFQYAFMTPEGSAEHITHFWCPVAMTAGTLQPAASAKKL
jgi:hypothetical protein